MFFSDVGVEHRDVKCWVRVDHGQVTRQKSDKSTDHDQKSDDFEHVGGHHPKMITVVKVKNGHFFRPATDFLSISAWKHVFAAHSILFLIFELILRLEKSGVAWHISLDARVKNTKSKLGLASESTKL